ncbi:hypothetical protein LTR36_003775 [Oleoguttula mirabilis]|uniref:CCHC-type domain-containing protein n=1 Tax=Oleoguttula mirabilis TaxID=1507867 RepID=A0AAV9JIB0_9PEZI|nr:hypothetical protein LTR36_003775 [Oleoguttula mirabilis]
MLCHNCDRWHLPTPCVAALYQCGQCGANGHLEVFCPGNATVRPLDMTAVKMQMEAGLQAGNKRADTITGLYFSREAEIQAIKYEVAKETIRLLHEGRFSDEVLEIMRTKFIPTREPLQGLLQAQSGAGYGGPPIDSRATVGHATNYGN